MNRKFSDLHAWLSSDSPYFRSFHPQVRDHAIVARDNGWDEQRISAENTINPIYFSELQIAALSLDDEGLSYYGPYCVVLREPLFEHRASVFEENPFIFNRSHNVVSGQMPPLGYRASWTGRANLAIAKLGDLLEPGTNDTEFRDFLMGKDREDPECDFIEVHIYGSLHKRIIESVSGPVPISAFDRVLWLDVKTKLGALGASVREF